MSPTEKSETYTNSAADEMLKRLMLLAESELEPLPWPVRMEFDKYSGEPTHVFYTTPWAPLGHFVWPDDPGAVAARVLDLPVRGVCVRVIQTAHTRYGKGRYGGKGILKAVAKDIVDIKARTEAAEAEMQKRIDNFAYLLTMKLQMQQKSEILKDAQDLLDKKLIFKTWRLRSLIDKIVEIRTQDYADNLMREIVEIPP